MQFVSIMGTQILAVLNPLLALCSDGINFEWIILLATENEKSHENALKLQDYLFRNNMYDRSRISIEPVCSAPNTGTPCPQVHEVVKNLVKAGQTCFNVAGGMNYQIALCAGTLKPGRDFFVYPDSSGIHLFGITADKKVSSRQLPLPEPLNILTLFQLQGVQTKKGQQSYFPWGQLKKYKIFPPEPCARKVRIGKVQFDLVWNRGNELFFIKSIWNDYRDTQKGENRSVDSPSRKESDPKNKERLAGIRDLIHLVCEREGFGELYHRNVGVLTNDKHVAARLREEASHKVKVFDFSSKKSEAAAALNKIIRPTGQAIAPDNSTLVYPIPDRSSEGKTLVIALGANPSSTLLAIWSHRPARVILLFTPGETVVERVRKAFIDSVGLFPHELSVLEFRPVSINGLEIIEMPTPAVPAKKMIVNITPGTKGQGVCLALWAVIHGAGIYSIRTEPAALCRLDGMDEHPLAGPSPSSYLRLTGANIESLGHDASFLAHSETNKLLLRFFRAMVTENGPIDRFPFKKIVLCGFTTNYKGGKNKELSLVHNTSSIKLHLTGGEWFEDLVGYALHEYGADDVQVRIRTSWPSAIRQSLKEKSEKQSWKSQDGEIFMSDLDVVVLFGGNYILISCKAKPQNDEEFAATAEEAAAQAQLFGRFCVPMVCNLYHKGEPIRSSKHIPVFGYRTLADKNAMLDLIFQRLQELRKAGSPDSRKHTVQA